MTFDEAADYILQFGKYVGWTVGEVANTDEGLKYLDWLRGQDYVYAETREALSAYLDDETIAMELSALLEAD
jgi:hypothetical protein